MTQVNLLPSEVRDKQKTRRNTMLIVAASVAALAVLFFVFVLQVGKLSTANRDLRAQQAQNSALQTKILSLQRFEDLQVQVGSDQALVTAITAGQVQWSGVLKDLSTIIPGTMWLTQVTGTVTPPTGVAPTATTPLIGNLQFGGSALDQPTVALWLTRLEEIKGWVNPWVSSDTKQGTGSGATIGITSTVDLTKDATTNGRQQ
jgi:Tfp pilus assembly protein PilN